MSAVLSDLLLEQGERRTFPGADVVIPPILRDGASNLNDDIHAILSDILDGRESDYDDDYQVVLQMKAIRRFVITEKALTRAFSWLKAATTAFTFKTLLRHYAKRALTPRSLNVKLGPRHKSHKGWAVWLA